MNRDRKKHTKEMERFNFLKIKMTTLNTLISTDLNKINKMELISYENELRDIFRQSDNIWRGDYVVMQRIEEIKSLLNEKILWKE